VLLGLVFVCLEMDYCLISVANWCLCDVLSLQISLLRRIKFKWRGDGEKEEFSGVYGCVHRWGSC